MAACPRRFEFGTKTVVEHLGTFVCEDRTAAYLDGWDIWMGETEEDWQKAIRFGRQAREVIVYD